MANNISRLWLVIIALLSAYPSDKAIAKEVHAAVGLSLAPYVIKGEDRGMEVDIIRKALEHKGHTLKLRHVLLKQVPEIYKKGKVDAALTINEALGLDGCLSDVAITYQNFAISLASNQLKLESVDDLKGRSVVAFQNAKLYLGDDYKNAVESSRYHEVANQIVQVTRLLKGRELIAIADKNIFLHFRSKVNNIDTSPSLTFHPIFQPSDYRVAFRDDSICNDFNEGLKHIKDTGEYGRIVKRYVQ